MANKVLMITIRILIFLFFCLLLVYAFVESSEFAYDVFSDTAYQEQGKQAAVYDLEIREGDSVGQIAKRLEAHHIVEDDLKFSLSLRTFDDSNAIKPGTYTLRSTMKPSEILEVISGKGE